MEYNLIGSEFTIEGAVLTNRNDKNRSSTDLYPTPENVTIALLNQLKIAKGKKILEPACGQGHMSKVLSNYDYDVISSDLYETGYGESGKDFLKLEDIDCDWIITNPPFSLSEQFIKKCITLNKPFALLLKSQYWHSSKRRKLFYEFQPKAIYPLTWRPDFLFGAKSSSPTMEVLWTVWDRVSSKQTIYLPLEKPYGNK